MVSMQTPSRHLGAAQEQSGFSDRHVVHVVRQYAPMVGGLEDFVRQLVARQRGRFASLQIVTLDRLFTQPDTKLPDEEVIDDVVVHRIPYSGSSRYPIAPAVFSKLKRADLVHVHAVDFFFDALALCRPWHRRRLVATTHGGFFHTDTLLGLKKLWLNGMTRLSATQYEAIACCSQNDLTLFEKVAPSKVRLIENGVDLSKFQNAASNRPEKRLVTIGRFSENKRLERLLDALQRLCALDAQWKLEIVGGPSDLTTSDLARLISQKGLSDQVTVHVKLPDAQVRDIMSKCSFFVSASEYEGFGIAMIEGMSAGLIPIVEPNNAFQGLAQKHPLVRLSSFTNPAEVANTIFNAFSDLTSKPQLREEAMTSAAQHSWETTIKHYDALYRDAFNK